jgi:hypothetical protein
MKEVHTMLMTRSGAILAVLASSTLAAAGEVVVSNTYENLDAKTDLEDVPVTFSRVGARGDFSEGITPMISGRKLPAQVDVLRRAEDGSIRHALVSLVLPRLAGGSQVRIDWLDEKPPEPKPFVWAVDWAGFGLKLTLQSEAGTALTSDMGSVLRHGWKASTRVRVLHDGPVMKEIEIHDVPVDSGGKPDPHLDLYWRLRAFSSEKSIRVAAVVERCKPRKVSGPEPVQYKFRAVTLHHGDKVLYEEGRHDHLDQTRYRILCWTDGPPENIHRRPDYDYWVKGKFFPKYRFTQPTTAAQVDATYAKRTESRNNQRRAQGILEPGIIHRHMPGTGGRWEMEPYPAWSVGYLLSGAPKTYRAILHADGNGAGAFYIHVRQDGMPGYDVRTVRPKPLDRGYRIPLYRLPDGTKPPVQPDHAHAPSLGYVAYLLTGDRFYAEEASFWASFQLGEWPHKGLRWEGMDRAFAYGLRHVVDAAYILPDDHPLLPYFTWSVNDCMDQMTRRLVRSGRRVHSPIGGVFRCSGRADWVNAKRCSAWQCAWAVWSLGNAADKGFVKAEAVRDWAAAYIVGFYASDDEFTAPDGKTYRYDPRDAMPYSTATQLLETAVVTDEDGRKRIRVLGEGDYLENYGAIWYYTKLNEDNSFTYTQEPSTRPDANGNWPLRKAGWGRGLAYMPATGETRKAWGWHRYGAWVGLVVALEAGVPKAQEAWDTMRRLASEDAIYGYEMTPRE